MPTINELKMLQALPLEVKIMKTEQRIREWVNYYGLNGVYLSFSGGKDSTVLAHIIERMGLPIQKVFADTGLEYPEIRAFVKAQGDVIMIRPKMRFDEVIRKYGYPIIGKEVALCIEYAKKGSQWAINNLDGLDNKGRPYELKKNMYGKYKPLVEVDFNISAQCCRHIKERPLDEYKRKSGAVNIVATTAEESERRQKAWLKTGCNAFASGVSKPLSFWTEQDILAYIKAYNVPIASVYGEVVYENNGALYSDTICDCGSKLCTTGCHRTGCIFCGFGAHLEKGESRFERLRRTHPRQYEYCVEGGAYDTDGMWKPTTNGLGMRHVFDKLNEIYGKGFIKY